MVNRAWYALRRTITPWNSDSLINELADFCKSNHIDEVIFKVDTEEFSHNLPTIEWLDNYLPILKKAKQAILDIEVKFSINPWVTLVHCDRGRDNRRTFPDIQMIVGHDGSECKACACPLSEGWQKLTKELWKRYASLKPDVLWIEDDIRLLNHNPVRYGCFCDLHMARFSEIVGKKVTREELVEALYASGNPHTYRAIWLDMNRDIMIDIAKMFEYMVHSVSPETKLGLMCSMPNHHSMEGRDWNKTTSAFAGDNKLVARPCMGNYNEESMKGLYFSDLMLKQTMHCLPKDTIIQTEVENVPFTIYSKSAKFTFLQIALSFVLGSDGVTMNLFDHLGSPIIIAPEYGKKLRDKKPYLSSLKERCFNTKSDGIQILHFPDGAKCINLTENPDFLDLAPEAQDWHSVLEPLGFPVTFEKNDVVALNGQAIRSFSDSQIKDILSKGVILDLSALKALNEMGYEQYTGVSIINIFNRNEKPYAAEEYFNSDFGGGQHKYLTLTLPYLSSIFTMADIKPCTDAVVISRSVDADTKPMGDFVTLYENQLGGRIAVYPIDIREAGSCAFFNPYRKEQLHNVINWLSKNKNPMSINVNSYILPFISNKDNYTVFGAFNLTLDSWLNAEFDIYTDGKLPAKIELLNEDGTWSEDNSISWKVENKRLIINYAIEVKPASLEVFTIFWG